MYQWRISGIVVSVEHNGLGYDDLKHQLKTSVDFWTQKVGPKRVLCDLLLLLGIS